MREIKLESNVIETVQYDLFGEYMVLKFKNGNVYKYYDISAVLFAGLMTAESHGAYFNKYISKKHHDTRIDD